jgi:hypothetical protein
MKAHPRREFLLSVLAACGTPFFASSASGSAAQATLPGPPLDRHSQAAASYFGAGAGAARAVGEAYLRQLDLQPDRDAILELTRGVMDIIASASSQQAAVTALVGAVRRDFRDGRVLQLEGWIVSRTEVELCVLTFLPAPV